MSERTGGKTKCKYYDICGTKENCSRRKGGTKINGNQTLPPFEKSCPISWELDKEMRFKTMEDYHHYVLLTFICGDIDHVHKLLSKYSKHDILGMYSYCREVGFDYTQISRYF